MGLTVKFRVSGLACSRSSVMVSWISNWAVIPQIALAKSSMATVKTCHWQQIHDFDGLVFHVECRSHGLYVMGWIFNMWKFQAKLQKHSSSNQCSCSTQIRLAIACYRSCCQVQCRAQGGQSNGLETQCGAAEAVEVQQLRKLCGC